MPQTYERSDEGKPATGGNGPTSAPDSPETRALLDVVAWSVALVILSWSIVGIAAAMFGWFHAVPVLVGTILVSAFLCKTVLPKVKSGPRRTRPHWALTALMIVVVLASGIWNASNHGEHIIAERDPGMYTTSALWLTNNGNLRIGKPSGAFKGSDAVTLAQNGFDDNTKGSFDSWWPDLNVVFLAGAAWAGYQWLFIVPAVLTALGLFALFLLGCRLGSPIAGAIAAIAFAVSYPLIYVSRDQFSEPLALVLLLGGLWALTFVPRCGNRVAFVAGALLGAICLARIDGLIPLIPLVCFLSLQISIARRQGRERRAEHYSVALMALALLALLGIIETWQFASGYFHTRFLPRLPVLILGALVAAIIGRIAASSYYRVDTAHVIPTRGLRIGFGVFAACLTIFVIWERFIRPDVAGLRAAYERGSREYWAPPGELLMPHWGKTLGMLWIEWYLGPLLLIGGIAALVWLTGVGLHSRSRCELPVAMVGLLMLLVYLILPQVGPDLPWATRRYVVAAIPLMLLALALAGERIARLRPPLSLAAVAVFTVVAISFPVRATIPLADTAVGRSLANRYDQICALAHDRPSAILVTPDLNMAETVPLGLGQWCGIPVAGAVPGITATQIRTLQADWERRGRRLLLLTSSPEGLAGVGGVAIRIKGPPLLKPEATFTHASDRIVENQFLLDFPQPSGGNLPMYIVDPSLRKGG